MKPLIGVASSPYTQIFADEKTPAPSREKLDFCLLLARLTEQICSSVFSAGGIPVILTPCGEEAAKTAAAKFDGFILAGGEDLHPPLYGKMPAGSDEPDTLRDDFEMALIKELISNGRPVLGICRGAQIMNAALGGTLYQDLAA